MLLTEVTIENFCSCANVEVELGSYTPIIGYNNAGKSNVLRAIVWLLKRTVLPPVRFTDAALPVIVSGSIKDVDLNALPANQQAQVGKYLNNGRLRFRRRQEVPSAKLTDIKLEVFDATSGQWVANPTGLDNAIGVLFPEPIYIEAMDDASEDVSQFAAKNTIGLLLKNTMELIRTQNAVALNALASALASAGAHINGPARIAEFALFEAQATTALNDFFPGLTVHLGMQSPTVDDVVKTAAISLSDAHGIRLGFTSFGHGTQRTVQMALISLLATQLKPAGAGATTTILLIDEPELYLHPHAIELLRESLQRISQNSFQVILTTHSPLLVGKDEILNTLVVLKDAVGRTKVRRRLAEAATVLNGKPHHAAVVFSLQHASYLLFAESVVVVEGKTEKMILPELYRCVRGSSLAKAKVCVIEVHGSSSVAPTLQVLRAVGFVGRAIVDLDYVFKQGPRNTEGFELNPDYVACKDWLAANSAAVGFVIGPDGFPLNSGGINAAAAFESMAVAMPDQVERLAVLMLAGGFWVWRRGAIESHLGVAKSDADRIAFINTMIAAGTLDHAADSASLTACANWI